MVCRIFDRACLVAAGPGYCSRGADFISPWIRQCHGCNHLAPCGISFFISGTDLETMLRMILQVIVQIGVCISHRIELSVDLHLIALCTFYLVPMKPDGRRCFLLFRNRQFRYGKLDIFLFFSFLGSIDESQNLHTLGHCLCVRRCHLNIKFWHCPHVFCHLQKLCLRF